MVVCRSSGKRAASCKLFRRINAVKEDTQRLTAADTFGCLHATPEPQPWPHNTPRYWAIPNITPPAHMASRSSVKFGSCRSDTVSQCYQDWRAAEVEFKNRCRQIDSPRLIKWISVWMVLAGHLGAPGTYPTIGASRTNTHTHKWLQDHLETGNNCSYFWYFTDKNNCDHVFPA